MMPRHFAAAKIFQPLRIAHLQLSPQMFPLVDQLPFRLRDFSIEATRRGYSFDASKIGEARFDGKIAETKGQLLYEWEHLRRKLEVRDPERLEKFRSVEVPRHHPLFRMIAGGVREWEKVAPT